MRVEFDYSLDENKGEITLCFSKGFLNEAQQNALKQAIKDQESKLRVEKSGLFRPQIPIPGLGEDVSFEYSLKPSPPRSVLIGMTMKDAIVAQLPKDKKENISKPLNEGLAPKTSEQSKQSEWVTLFIDSLNQCLLNASTTDSPASRAEKAALNYTVNELKNFLVTNQQNNTLLLFSAYLYLAETHFRQQEKHEAAFFSIAARAIENQTNLNEIETSVNPKPCLPKSKNQLTSDSLDKGGNAFLRIFQRFFATK